MWLIIEKATQRVKAVEQAAEPAAGAYDSNIFDIKKWEGAIPRLPNPIEDFPGDLDPTLSNPDYAQWLLDQAAIDDSVITTKDWLEANPNAMLLLDATVTDLNTQITNLVNALFPSGSTANKNKMILLLMTLSMSVRVLVKREGLG